MGFRHIGFIHMHTTISRALYELKTSVQRRIFKKSPHNFHTCLSSHVSHTIDGLFFIFHLLRRGLLCFVAHIIIFRLVFFLFISFSLYLSQIYGTHITHERKKKKPKSNLKTAPHYWFGGWNARIHTSIAGFVFNVL